jgi:hypothetical protein
MTAPINLAELRELRQPAKLILPVYRKTGTVHAGADAFTRARDIEHLLSVLPALITAVEAARELAEALDDAISAHVNDNAGWTQADYDKWDAARRRGDEALTPFQP